MIGKRASLPWQMTARLAHPCHLPVQLKVLILEFACHRHQKPQTYSSEYPNIDLRGKRILQEPKLFQNLSESFAFILVYTAYFEFVNKREVNPTHPSPHFRPRIK